MRRRCASFEKFMESPDDCYPPADAAANLKFAWLGFDYVFEERAAKVQACRDFNISLVEVLLFNRWKFAHVNLLSPCFGALLFNSGRDIPFGFAQVCDYFFARDKREALVYTWLPHECRFRLVDQDWVNLRRRK